MANADKNILITPNVGSATSEPTIRFTGFNNTPTTLRVLDDGTISFEATAGQLLAIRDGLSGSIYSVNDISGVPSLEVMDTGLVKINQYGGFTALGGSTAIVSAANSASALFSLHSRAATMPLFVAKGAVSQSGNLLEFQNSSGSIISRIRSTGYLGILSGGDWPVDVLASNTATIADAVGSRVESIRTSFTSTSPNTSSLEILGFRTAAGSSWVGSGWRLQSKVDATWQAWMQFNESQHGITWGSGNSTVSASAVLPRMRLNSAGNLELFQTDANTTLTIETISSTAARFPALVIRNQRGDGTNDYAGHPVVELQSSRGTSAARAASGSGDILGGVNAWGYTGAAFVSGGRIEFVAEAAWSAGEQSTLLRFLTRTTTTEAERARFTSAGDFLLGTTTSRGRITISAGTNDATPEIAIGTGSSNRFDFHHSLSAGGYNPIVSAGDRGIVATGTNATTSKGSLFIGPWSDISCGIRFQGLTTNNIDIYGNTAFISQTASVAGFTFRSVASPTVDVFRVQSSASANYVTVSSEGVFHSPFVTNAQTGAYTLVLADAGKLVEVNSAAGVTVTIPTNATAAYATGSQINILQTGAGQVTIAGAGGVTVNGTPGLKLRAQWSSATLIKRGTDTWVVAGDLAA